ncbi:MAG: hypothetical protein Q7S58_10710 [Candidatus Binatus sp.]|uniref:hypothetical protein n=1 Tax=Candidatus Binatus sp. TaxID=2811406 RepID=UPI0027218392|nr:hypothetical protein [Candidatus Binatus sp.]MDO8432865.1 hypothetical protein [Candidatus Binatus sp.]
MPRGPGEFLPLLLIISIVITIAVVPLAARAGDPATFSEYDSEDACHEIKAALNALAAAEHRQALALDLASEGASSAIVAARLSDLLDRSQDLRVVLKRARHSKVARETMVDQCTRMGFRALVISEKLTSDVEAVLFGGDDDDDSALAALPQLKSGGHSPPPAVR